MSKRAEPIRQRRERRRARGAVTIEVLAKWLFLVIASPAIFVFSRQLLGSPATAPAAQAAQAASERPDGVSGNGPLPPVSPRMIAIVRETTSALSVDPQFQRYVDSQQQRLQAGRPAASDPKVTARAWAEANAADELTQLGLARLLPSELADMVATQLKLAEKSPELCADFGLGKFATDEMFAIMDRVLTSAELRRWFELSAVAARLELNATAPSAKVSGDEVATSLTQVLNAVSVAERQELEATLQMGAAAPPAAACRAFLRLMSQTLQLAEKRRDPLLRGLAFKHLIDWGASPPSR